MGKKVTILGSTGTIGENTLKVISKLKQNFSVFALSAKNNVDKLVKQAKKFSAKYAVIRNENKYSALKDLLETSKTIPLAGIEGLRQVSADKNADIVVIGISGSEGIYPLLEAVKHNKRIALANKESIVMAGQIINSELKKYNSELIPLDSEHNAIYQCIKGNGVKYLNKIILTASGGPFKDLPAKRFSEVTPEQAIVHPKWNMGKKISVDSATLMNKALEIVEAKYLFKLSADKVKVLIHPEAIIHSMVEFVDGNIIALLGVPDMRLPIQYALTYPDRLPSDVNKLQISDFKHLSFEEPNIEKFTSLKLGYKAVKLGGTLPTVMNAANEIAVASFLKHEIGFHLIVPVIESAMSEHTLIQNPGIDDIFKVDEWARRTIKEKICKIKRGENIC